MMGSNEKSIAGSRVTLDWSRLLGFDQAERAACEGAPIARRARAGSLGKKLGVKPGGKPKRPA
jgi:hypothetical protein